VAGERLLDGQAAGGLGLELEAQSRALAHQLFYLQRLGGER
jgi:hypothetical protein